MPLMWVATIMRRSIMKATTKNIPKALYTGAVIVIAIYVIINMAFLYVLPVSAIANSSLVASDVAKIIFGNQGAFIATRHIKANTGNGSIETFNHNARGGYNLF